MSRPRGFLAYDGPSLIDRHLILGIVTLRSVNVKTGDTAQLWILRRSVPPVVAVQTGKDVSICGSCPLRGDPGFSRRACYVEVGRAPQAVWHAWKRGIYPHLKPQEWPSALAGRAIRLGAYGEPTAIPARILAHLTRSATRWTGYTHRWQEVGASYQKLLMASVESEVEAEEAQSRGWRTFRIRREGEDNLPSAEVVCPASEEAGKKTTCSRCTLCSGSVHKAKSVSIKAHGSGGIYL